MLCNQGRTEANLRFGPRTKKAPLYIEQFPWELNFLIVVKCYLPLLFAVYIELTVFSFYSFHYQRRLKLCKILNNYKKYRILRPHHRCAPGRGPCGPALGTALCVIITLKYFRIISIKIESFRIVVFLYLKEIVRCGIDFLKMPVFGPIIGKTSDKNTSNNKGRLYFRGPFK